MKYVYKVKNLDCANCAREIQEGLSKNKDLKNVIVNFSTLQIKYETENLTKLQVEKLVQAIEPEVVLEDIDNSFSSSNKINYSMIRFLIGIALVILSNFLHGPMKEILIILAYIILLYRTTKNAIKLIMQKTINENFLITISCIGAYILGEKIEGLMVIILYEIGKILEEKAINKSRRSISELMNIKPEYANLKSKDGIQKVNPENVKIDDIVVIKEGEKIPLDGIVVSGEAYLDTSSLTGESKQRKVKVGEEVLSGSINKEGLIELKVVKEYENSTVNKILELVQNATDKKAKTETFVNKITKIYTPIVIFLAVVVAIFLPVVSDLNYSESIYRALTFLVISCPCAIAISVPLSYFSGIGKASKRGILIKGSNFLDNLRLVKHIAFDKTGTLTKGEFGISNVEVINEKYSKEDVLKYIVYGESFSNHPIAKSILKSNILKEYNLCVSSNSKIDTSVVSEYDEISGKGISYKIDGKKVLIGNAKLVGLDEESLETTVIYAKVEGEIIGKIELEDIIKPDAKDTISNLKMLGVKTKMLTGDTKGIAEKVARDIGIEKFKAGLLPQDKYNEIEKMREENVNAENKIAFVGDGINDSPVLALSDVGISMGGIGTDAAIEASDVVIMTDDLEKIPEAINISKKVNKIIKQNLIFAIGVKILVLTLSTLGISKMWEAIFADVGVTLITILNTLRILL